MKDRPDKLILTVVVVVVDIGVAVVILLTDSTYFNVS